MIRNWKPILTTLFKIAVAGTIIAWLVHKQSLDLRVLMQLVRPEYMPLLLGLPLLNLLLNHYRWLILLQAQQIPVTFWPSLPLSFIGLFFNFAIPGGVGGDVVKGFYLLQDYPARKLNATVTVLLDRIVGVFAMLLLASMAVLFNPQVMNSSAELKTLAFTILACVAGASLFFTFVFTHWLDPLGLTFDNLPRWKMLDVVRRLHDTVGSFRQDRWALIKCIGMSWLSHLTAIAFIATVVSLTSHEGLPWHTYFFVVPLGFIAMALPIAPAGIGVGQAAFFFLFKLYTHQESQVGPNAITAFQASQLCLGLIGAYFFLRRRKQTESSWAPNIEKPSMVTGTTNTKS